MGCNGVLRLEKHRQTSCDEFFIPTGQSAIAKQRLQKTRNPERKSRRVRKRLEHVRNDAPLFQQGVVKRSNFRCNLVTLEQQDASRGCISRHARKHTAERAESGAACPRWS